MVEDMNERAAEATSETEKTAPAKPVSGFKKFVAVAGVVGVTAAPAFLNTSCKKQGEDITPQDTTKTNPGGVTNKDSIARAEEAKLIAAARERVTFGNQWAEYYGGPEVTGKNDAGEPMQTGVDLKAYDDYIVSLKGKFKEIAIEPAFVKPGLLPEAIARVNISGVDVNNASHNALKDALNAIGEDAYIHKNGQRVVNGGVQLINFENPQAVAALKQYIAKMGQDYKGVFIIGAGDFERYRYANGATNPDDKQIASMRSALKEVSGALKTGGKTVVVGDVAVTSPIVNNVFNAKSSLAYFVNEQCTHNIQYYLPYGATKANFAEKFGDPNLNFFTNMEGANVRFSVTNQQDRTDKELGDIRTAIGKSTGVYVALDKPFYAGLYTAPKVAAVSVFIADNNNMMNRDDLGRNLELTGQKFRSSAALGMNSGSLDQGLGMHNQERRELIAELQAEAAKQPTKPITPAPVLGGIAEGGISRRELEGLLNGGIERHRS